jgi:sulfotransferase
MSDASIKQVPRTVQFVCLSGLPRSGSTLLSAILSQNPRIHAEGNSAVCQFMWNTHTMCFANPIEQIEANNRTNTLHEFVSHIPNIYYKNIGIEKEIIVDKCRAWTVHTNFSIAQKYIDPNIKYIVIERSVLDVIKSFAKLYTRNKWSQETINSELNKMLIANTEPIMVSLNGIRWAKQNNANNNFLFINYNQLVEEPAAVIQSIYRFCEWTPYAHTFTNIVNIHPENDSHYNLKGFHAIRATIEKEPTPIVLDKAIEEKCLMLNKIMGYA